MTVFQVPVILRFRRYRYSLPGAKAYHFLEAYCTKITIFTKKQNFTTSGEITVNKIRGVR